MSRPTRYPPPFRAQAVAQVVQVRSQHRSEWSAIEAVATALGISREALRGWVRQVEGQGQPPSTLRWKDAELRRLSEENAQLRAALRALQAGPHPPPEAPAGLLEPVTEPVTAPVEYGL